MPKGGEVAEAGEQAGKGGKDESVQRRHQPGMGGVVLGRCTQVGGDAGEMLGQGLWVMI